ncbi:long-chain-fatty-acid--CoA ligase [Candidatus Termititenax spirochaetophilus]|uniref:Long-chain-fatty-acid--CoA ligase n=1 Tax=Candidatus Termititenax spirochaetophilus TaxID=2218522 RepID=A0A388T7H2_9BACT|nr:long-chain-fatty-acid--CoA ligase [Candidatus Termititenax spirochaetophilus]
MYYYIAMPNLFAKCEEVTAKYPKDICFVDGGLTYQDVWLRVQARASALHAKGLRKGDVVALLSKNSPEWIIAFLAITSLGARVLVLDTNLRVDMYKRMIEYVDTKLVYVSKEFANDDYGVEKWAVDVVEPPHAFELTEQVDSADIAALFYTSGTTGEPKVVPLTHNNLIQTAVSSGALVRAGTTDMFLNILPLYHVYGLIAGFLGPYVCGASVVFQNSLKATDMMAALAKYPITIFSAVPQMWEVFFDRFTRKIKNESKLKYKFFMFLIENAPSFRHVGLGRLVDKIFYPVHKAFGLRIRYLLSGGARLGRRYCLYYKHMGFTVIEGYGLTETTGPICGGNPDNPTPICVGKPIGDNYAEVRNLNDDDIGEVWLKGVSVMPGYYNNPEATKKAFDANGWLNTGDLGFIDKNGELHIRGRFKNVIVLDSGKNVYPEDLEAYYLASPLVAEITIFGRQVNKREVVYAVVVPTFKTRDCYARIKTEFKKMNQGLPTYKIVTDFAVSYDVLPRTSTQKVRNHEVIKLLEDGAYQVSEKDPNFVVKEITAATPELEKVITALKAALATDVFYANQILADFTVDSLDYLLLIAKLETRLNISINPSKFIAAPTIEALIDFLSGCPNLDKQTVQQDIFASKITTRTYNFYNPVIELGLWLIKIYSKVFWRLQIKHGEKLKINNDLIIANHQSYLDILWLLCILPYHKRKNICIAGKRELWPLKLIFPGVHIIYVDRAGNYVPALKAAADILRSGKSLIIFPEGTRSYDGQIGKFKNGVAYLAKNLHKKILPISIKGAYEIFPRKNWLPKLITIKQSSIDVHDKIDPDKFDTIEELNSRMKELIQE